MTDTMDQADTPEPDIIDSVLGWVGDGHGAALATVVSTWGSSPRPAGSQLAIRDDNSFLGSVSGGCIEGEVVTEALAAIRHDGFKVLDFGVTDEDAWQAGLACGGQVQVAVANVSPGLRDTLENLQAARQDMKRAALLTDMESGETSLYVDGNDGLPEGVDLTARFASDKSGVADTGDGHRTFAHIFNLPLRLFVVGAVHIAQALVKFAAESGYDVTVIDPRDTWGTAERFPGVKLDRRWPSKALEAAGLDARSAVVTLCHDPKLDDPALLVAINSDAFYIGSLGSRKTHAKRIDRLTAEGATEEQLARIHGPVGLDIGAQSTPEIAISTMAQITQALRQQT